MKIFFDSKRTLAILGLPFVGLIAFFAAVGIGTVYDNLRKSDDLQEKTKTAACNGATFNHSIQWQFLPNECAIRRERGGKLGKISIQSTRNNTVKGFLNSLKQGSEPIVIHSENKKTIVIQPVANGARFKILVENKEIAGILLYPGFEWPSGDESHRVAYWHIAQIR